MFNERYKISLREKLGCGVYGNVFLEKGGKAVKVIKPERNGVMHPSTLRELGILQMVKHGYNLLELEYARFVREDLYIIMRAYDTTLFDMIYTRDFNPRPVVNGIIHGLHFLHTMGIVHRDLKPMNIMVYEGNVKIIDFGLARYKPGKRSSLEVVSPPYRAPELIREEAVDDAFKLDIWSFGCIIYEIYNNKPLFTPRGTLENQIENIKETLQKKDIFSEIDGDYRDVVKKCLYLQPGRRIALSDVFVKPVIRVPRMMKEKVAKRHDTYAEVMKHVQHTLGEKTKRLVEQYIVCYLNKHSLKKTFIPLLAQTAVYIATKVNETYFPSPHTIVSKEYTIKSIAEMERLIVKSCDGNMWMVC